METFVKVTTMVVFCAWVLSPLIALAIVALWKFGAAKVLGTLLLCVVCFPLGLVLWAGWSVGRGGTDTRSYYSPYAGV